MIKRGVFLLVAAFMLAAGGAVLVVAGAFGIYQLLKPGLGAAGASGALAGAAALFLIVGGFITLRIAQGPRRPQHREPASALDRALDIAKERPIAAAVAAGAAAIAAAVIAVRNPAIMTAVVASLLGSAASRNSNRR